MNHLDVWTDYSFMRAYMLPKQALARAKRLGSTYFGMADYCSTWGHVPFGKVMLGAGLRFVPGVTLPVVAQLDKNPAHDLVAVYAKTGQLQKLYELVKVANEQTYFRPRVLWEQLTDPDLVVVAYAVAPGNTDLMQAAGACVALRPCDSLLQRAARAGELPLAPLVLACAPRFASPADREGYETVERASELQRIGETGRQLKPLHMATAGELQTILGVEAAVLEAAQGKADAIAEECHLPQFPRASLPPAPDGWSLADAVAAGAVRRGLDTSGPYGERIARELEVIEAKGFAPYFYFVSEIVNWARGEMLVGPGRGSAGGCLVAYCLGITNVDPIVHGTLFERFIDPTRNDMPDIDVDFQDSRRDLVYEELRRRYGADRVARLGTTTELGGKSAINEVARFERHIPWSEKRALAVQADGVNVPLSVLFEVDEVSKAIVEKHPELRASALLDGHVRHHGVHAAGVCVAAEPITTVAGINREGVCAVTLDDAETVNLLKFDALGLTTLSVIADACAEIGMDPYELQDLPLDDQKAYEIFRKDMVTGIFQFEGHTVRGLMREVEVDRFTDLSALASLARPGPLQGGAAAAWVKRRMGVEEWAFEHPALEPITRDTYGLIVYEEQMMAILRDIAGFDVGKVNKARKAVKKKDPEMLRAFANDFIDGAAGVIGKLADPLWAQIEEFGAYAFNRAHATAYGMISYHCAWLKAYHPQAFAIGLLRHCSDDEKAKIVIRELTHEGMAFCPFDPALSEASWSVKGGTLYGGFLGLQGVGRKTAEKFLAARAADPEGWMRELTPAQRYKLNPLNTPWATMDEIGRQYGAWFDDPDRFNVKGPIYRISDVPHRKGSYVVIAKLKKLQPKDQNEPERVAKRGGRRITGLTKFLNAIWEDDGVELGSTINRFKYEEMGLPLEEDPKAIGSYYLMRGEILGGDGPKWLMLDKLRKLPVQPFETPEQE